MANKHTQRYSALLVIREIQIKTPIALLEQPKSKILSPPSVDKDVEQLELLTLLLRM